MNIIALILNLPWSVCGLVGTILSIPVKMTFCTQPVCVIFHVRSFWWYRWLPGHARVRAIVNGNIIQLGPQSDRRDLAHEFIHVQQYAREPFVHPFLYILETFKHGYRKNT